MTQPGAPASPAALRALVRDVGSSPGQIMWYVAWSLNTGFPVADADRTRAAGAVPEITWEPWNPARAMSQTRYALARIVAGDFDRYIGSWARAVATWGFPLRLRFAQEMNGSWYPWAEGVNGNAAGSYVAAWRHVHRIFAAAGADNVTWIWSPNVPYPGSTPMAELFPGDTVDEIAIDGYNWGNQQGRSWASFDAIFRQAIEELSAMSRRPISIGEVGCSTAGGDKARWIAAMWRTLAQWPRVHSVTWFDLDKEADWRIASSAASARAFASGLSSYLAR
ncbi:glycoside hydrolase family 26 protein [uncultured Jatrophihabitans sp.]|uniref:glycoside hydrolase family 26 protein n=1 Tax=uncultured Jatrophihabitans sp. TaxID=1610747 RepID=UPI0035CBE896